MAGTFELTPTLGSAAACRAMGLWRGAPGRHKARAHRSAFVGPPSVPGAVKVVAAKSSMLKRLVFLVDSDPLVFAG